jgi:hypothetical protein
MESLRYIYSIQLKKLLPSSFGIHVIDIRYSVLTWHEKIIPDETHGVKGYEVSGRTGYHGNGSSP